MSEAKKLMNKKRFIKKEMDEQLSKALSDEVWERSTEKLSSLLEKYRDIPEGVKGHTNNYIFPSACVYQTLKEVMDEDKAYKIIEDAAVKYTLKAGKALAGLMRIPGMKSLFIKFWDPLTRKRFGADNGFENVFYPKKKDEFRMDIISCPYCRYFRELGCFELTKIYCANDDRVYGDLPGLVFERKGTLGRGNDKCDFCIRKK